ncbi:MAG: DUF4173 domain-containing protein [Flavobacteriales bacterium]
MAALSFSYLFYQSNSGVNLLLFEGLLVLSIHFAHLKNSWSLFRWLTSGAFLLTAIAYQFNVSEWTLFVNLVSGVMVVGAALEPTARSFWTVARLGAFNSVAAGFQFLHDLIKEDAFKVRGISKTLRFYYMMAPLAIIVLFVLIYRGSNPVFDGYMAGMFDGLDRWVEWASQYLNWQWIGVFVLGMIISVLAMVHVIPVRIVDSDALASMTMKRVRVKFMRGVSLMVLKNEWLAGMFLLVCLNLLLAVVNAIDVYWVWFNFEWQGEYLKQFVHEGTYLLILSILISVAIVLFFFRKNLNFYSRSIWLRRLCYLWLAQNIILSISVVVRNIHYINHFALASKRIGILFFLALVIFGIATVLIKVRDKKSAFYLFHWNTLSVFVVVVISALPNWQRIIATYNFSHYTQSFLHLDYLASFDPEAIPYTDYSLEELQTMEALQRQKFPFEERYMTAEEYHNVLKDKKTRFQEKMEGSTWKEWTWAKQKAIDHLNR